MKTRYSNCELGKEGSNLVSVTERMSSFFDIKSQRLSNLFQIEFMVIQEKIMFLGFFVLKFLRCETMLVLLAEVELVVLSATLHDQFGLRACKRYFTNRAVPLLFKRNLLLLRREPSILLILMNFTLT